MTNIFKRLVDVRDEEVAALLWSCAYFFFILSSYYLLRPMRETAGVAGGVENLPWLFTGTLIGMLLAHPLFTAAVARWPRRVFVPVTYRFFMLNLVVFYVLFRTMPEWDVWIGRIFFIWLSVFNLFVVSVFWSFMTDTWAEAQGKRLFGFIALGGTLGAITGSFFPAFLAERLGPLNLLLVGIVFLELAVTVVRRLSRVSERFAEGRGPAAQGAKLDEQVIGGTVLDGVREALRSPYLLGIAIYMLLYTTASTVLYFQQAEVVGAAFTDRASRTAVFGRIDLAVNVLTIVTQAFLTGRILRWLGLGLSLAVLPIATIIGFTWLGFAPTLAVVIGFQVIRRASNFAVARPAREVLYTVLPREDKYKAKNFIDTAVYRLGDQVSAWGYAGMMALGLSMSAIAFVTVPIAGMWLMIALALGRAHRRRSEQTEGM